MILEQLLVFVYKAKIISVVLLKSSAVTLGVTDAKILFHVNAVVLSASVNVLLRFAVVVVDNTTATPLIISTFDLLLLFLSYSIQLSNC